MSLTKQSSDNQLTSNILIRNNKVSIEGFKLFRIINETNLTSIIYGLYKKFDVIEIRLTFDCGGGNFGMCTLFIADQIFKYVAQPETSICLLGLRDKILVNYVTADFKYKHKKDID